MSVSSIGAGSSAAVNTRVANLDNVSDASGLVITDPCTVGIRFSTDGLVYELSGVPPGSYTSQGKWLHQGELSDFELRAVTDSGDPLDDDPSTGSWIPMTSIRTFQQTRATVGVEATTVTFTLRNALTEVELDSVQVTLTAQVDTL